MLRKKLENKAFLKANVDHLVKMRHATLHSVPRQRQRETKEIGETQEEIETYSHRERHCKTKRGGCE